jgi:hypothetical protein
MELLPNDGEGLGVNGGDASFAQPTTGDTYVATTEAECKHR